MSQTMIAVWPGCHDSADSLTCHFPAASSTRDCLWTVTVPPSAASAPANMQRTRVEATMDRISDLLRPTTLPTLDQDCHALKAHPTPTRNAIFLLEFPPPAR